MRTRFLAIVLILMLVYNANLRSIDSGDTQPARVLPMALLLEHTFVLDSYAAAWCGTVWQEKPYFLVPFREHQVSLYPVTQALLIWPLYVPAALYVKAAHLPLSDPRVGQVISMTAKLASSLIAALSAAFLFMGLSCMLDRTRSFWLALMYGLGCSVWAVSSQSLWQHGMSQLAFTVTVWLLLHNAEGATRLDLLGAGACAALAVTNRTPTVIFALCMGAYVGVRHGRQSWPYFVAPPFIATAWFAFNLHFYGHPLGGQAAAGAVGLLAGTWYEGLAGLLLGPSRGMVVYCPWVIASFCGGWKIWRSDVYPPILRYLTCAAAGQVLFYSFWPFWWGGSGFGPRLASDVFPLLVFLLVPLAQPLSHRGAVRSLFLISVAFSIGVQAAGAFLAFPPFNYVDNQWSWRDSQLAIMARRPILQRPLYWQSAPLFATIDRVLTWWRGPVRPLTDFSQQLELDVVPASLSAGQRFRLQVRCRNSGTQSWYDEDSGLGQYWVGLGARWKDEHGADVAMPMTRARLPRLLPPGEAATLDLVLPAPPQRGSYLLVLSMVASPHDGFVKSQMTGLAVPLGVQASVILASLEVGTHLLCGAHPAHTP